MPVPVCRDYHCFSDDLFPRVCLLRLRPISLDTRHEGQDDGSRVADKEDGETRDKKRPYIVGSRRAAERHDRATVTSLQAPRIKEQSRGRESECNEREGLRTRGSRDR
jgi:hypothetical protein